MMHGQKNIKYCLIRFMNPEFRLQRSTSWDIYFSSTYNRHLVRGIRWSNHRCLVTIFFDADSHYFNAGGSELDFFLSKHLHILTPTGVGVNIWRWKCLKSFHAISDSPGKDRVNVPVTEFTHEHFCRSQIHRKRKECKFLHAQICPLKAFLDIFPTVHWSCGLLTPHLPHN